MNITPGPRPIAPVPDPRAFDALMRTALKDEEAWGSLVAAPQGLELAEHWLKKTSSSIDYQISYRQDDLDQRRLTGEQIDVAELASHHGWRKSAVYLKSLCENRLIDAKRLRAEDRSLAEQMRVLLVTLGAAVLDHADELIDDDELYEVLDGIRLPGDDAPALRELVESIEDARDDEAPEADSRDEPHAA